MQTYYKFDGSEVDRTAKGLKTRIADTFRKPGQKLSNKGNPDDPGIMEEMATLTEKDMADLAQWFDAAGYPIAKA